MTLSIGIDLDSVKMDQRAAYIGQRLFSLKVISRKHTDTHTEMVGMKFGYAAM